MANKVDSYIARDPAGVCRVFVKRAKHKWWFELGKHIPTDRAFEQAFASGRVHWETRIQDKTKLF